STTIEEFKKSIYNIYKTPTLENPAVILRSLVSKSSFKFTVFIETPSKLFNKWIFPKMYQLYELSEDPNQDIDVYSVFLCGSVDLKCKKFQDVVKYLIAELELRQKTTPLNMSYEATKSIYSYCYLASRISVYENNFKIVPEKLVMRHNGQGNLDYAIECLTTNRIIGLVEIESSLTCQKCKANEINDECGLDKAIVQAIRTSNRCIYKDKNMQMKVERVLSHIIWLLKEALKPVEASPNREQSRVLKKQKSS
ncbi:6491_t:CDS:2, partial [Racocetra persica]